MLNKQDLALLARAAGIEEQDEFTEQIEQGMPAELARIFKAKKDAEKRDALESVAELIWSVRKEAIKKRQQLVDEVREIRRKERAKIAELRKLEAALNSTAEDMNYLPLVALLQPELSADIQKLIEST